MKLVVDATAVVVALLLSLSKVLCHDGRNLRSPQQHHHHDHDHKGMRCGTRDRTTSDRRAQQKALSLVQLKNAKNGDDGQYLYQANSPKIIPVCFHVIGHSHHSQKISRKDLTRNLEALNRAFSTSSCCDTSLPWCNGECSEPQTNIRFVMARNLFHRHIGTASSASNMLACVKHTLISWKMERPMIESLVKRFMRVGDGRVLNVYFADLGTDGLLGYAYFPSILRTDQDYLDGVVVHRDSRVGGYIPGYSDGDTLAHEVGHWLGLPHTFEGGCHPGDGISDTAAQAWPPLSEVCDPSVKSDTCPDQEGLDPIHNFMNYKQQECQFAWTQGQVDAMHANLEYYRSGRKELSPEAVELSLGEYSEKYTMTPGTAREFYVNVPTTSRLLCKTSADNGDIDFGVTWDDSESSECSSSLYDSDEACITKTANSGRANIVVSAYMTTIDFTIYCNVASLQDELELIEGSPETQINLAEGELQFYRVSLGNYSASESFGALECTTTASGTADVDLFLTQGTGDTVPDKFKCISATQESATESCEFDTLEESTTYYVGLFSAETSDVDVELQCKVLPSR